MTLRFLSRIRVLGLYFLVTTAVAVFTFSTARAQIGGVYDVLGVQVDVTADSATAAQREALQRAQQDALVALMERLVPQEERVRLPQLTAGLAEQLLSDFQVVQESRSDVRYLATVNVRFVPQRVREMLQSIPVPFAETQSKPLVVVPLYEAGGTQLLWSEANPWMRAWAAQPGPGGLVPLIMPLGDLGDIVAIDAPRAAAGDAAAQEAIAAQHGAVGALLVRATADSATDPSVLSVSAPAPRQGLSGVSFTVRRESGEAVESFFSRAAARVASSLQEDWKLGNTIAFDRRNSLEAGVDIFDLQQWGQVVQRLEKVNLLASRRVLRMTRTMADLRLEYFGDPQRLRVAFNQADLVLVGEPSIGWVIGRSEDASRLSPPRLRVATPNGGVTTGDQAPAVQ